MLWWVAGTLTLIVVVSGAAGLRATSRLADLCRQRFGQLFQNAPNADTSVWRTASNLARVTDEVKHLIARDPELARLRRTSNVCISIAAILILPAAYCCVILIGRLLSE